MLRFMLEKTTRDQGYVSTGLYTLDLDVPELEKELRSGGYGAGPNGDDFTHSKLIGIEVREGV